MTYMTTPKKLKDWAGIVSFILGAVGVGVMLLTPVFYMILIVVLSKADGWGVGVDYGLMFSDVGFIGLSLLTGFGYSGFLFFFALIAALRGMLTQSAERPRKLSKIMLWVSGVITPLAAVAFILTLP